MPPKTNPALDRRTAIRVGAVGAVATAATVVATSNAEAAAGQPVVQGAVNTVGTAGTTLSSSGTAVALTVKNTGAGAGAYFFAQNNNGFAGGTGSRDKYGLSAANTGAAGAGAGMAASGINNTGILANTNNSDRYGVEAINFSSNGPGHGGGLYAWGGEGVGIYSSAMTGHPAVATLGDIHTVDGNVYATARSGLLFSAMLTVGRPFVEMTGGFTLDDQGEASIVLQSPHEEGDVNLGSAIVTAFPETGPMPNLHGSVTKADGTLRIKGGVPGGFVMWRVTAPRVDAPTPWDPAPGGRVASEDSRTEALDSITAARQRAARQ